MKIWRYNKGAIEHDGTRIIFDEIHETHQYIIFKKGEIVATLDKSKNMIMKDRDMMPKIMHSLCDCTYCKGVDA